VEGFTGEIGAIYVPGIENIAKFFTSRAITFGVFHGKFDTKRVKQSLPAEHEQSPGGQSDELGKEAVK